MDHYIRVAQTALTTWLDDYTSGQVLLDRDWDNLRAAAQQAIAVTDTPSLDRLFAAIGWPSLYRLRFEVADWAALASDIPGAGPASFGAAALLDGFLGRFEDAERYARAGVAAAASPYAPDTFSCWLGLATALVGRREPAGIPDAVAAARQTGGLGLFGDAITSAILAGLETAVDPARAAELARRAETLLTDLQNPGLSADVLSNLGLYYGLAGDPARGLDYCRRALVLARANDARISVHTANAWLAQLALMGDLDDPTPTLREALAGAYQDRVWLHVWTIVAAMASWWATHDHIEAAGISVGYLDAHEFGTYGPDTIAATRARVENDAAGDRWLALGARLGLDQFVAYILEGTTLTDQLGTHD
jgi:tetratricopeptide (TPR) repeat protein